MKKINYKQKLNQKITIINLSNINKILVIKNNENYEWKVFLMINNLAKIFMINIILINLIIIMNNKYLVNSCG